MNTPAWLQALARSFHATRRPDISPPYDAYYGYHVRDAYAAGYEQALKDQGLPMPITDPNEERRHGD